MFTSVVSENAILHLEYFYQFDDINGHNIKYGKERNMNISIIQMYYHRAFPHWNESIGYHSILAFAAFISHKLALYGVNYVDVLLALFARALYFKFKAICKIAEEKLLSPSPILAETEHLSWKLLVKDHDCLCEVLDAMNNFFSPVVFMTYIVNIYFFCIQVHS